MTVKLQCNGVCFMVSNAERMCVGFQICITNAMEVLVRKYFYVEVRKFDIEGCHYFFSGKFTFVYNIYII